MGVGALCLVGLWVFMLAHHAWARIALMVVCTVEAVTQLVDLSAAAEVKLPCLDEHRDHRTHPHRGELNEARRWVRPGQRA